MMLSLGGVDVVFAQEGAGGEQDPLLQPFEVVGGVAAFAVAHALPVGDRLTQSVDRAVVPVLAALADLPADPLQVAGQPTQAQTLGAQPAGRAEQGRA